eukprot:28998-Pelagococcus_subviridis.AAC.1
MGSSLTRLFDLPGVMMTRRRCGRGGVFALDRVLGRRRRRRERSRRAVAVVDVGVVVAAAGRDLVQEPPESVADGLDAEQSPRRRAVRRRRRRRRLPRALRADRRHLPPRVR